MERAIGWTPVRDAILFPAAQGLEVAEVVGIWRDGDAVDAMGSCRKDRINLRSDKNNLRDSASQLPSCFPGSLKSLVSD